jgi:hypothetical protein
VQPGLHFLIRIEDDSAARPMRETLGPGVCRTSRIDAGCDQETVPLCLPSYPSRIGKQASLLHACGSTHRRWLRLLWAEVKKRIRMGFLFLFC